MIKISNHAKQRFCERIKDKTDKRDINIYMLENNERIEEQLNKMIEHSKLIYSGTSVSLYNQEPVDIYSSGYWILIVDKKKQNLVTLYSIDLGVGEEMNDAYIGKLLEKLDVEQKILNDKLEELSSQEKIYKAIIEENEQVIAENKKVNKSLEEQNDGYRQVIQNMNANKKLLEKNVREVVAKLIGKNVF